MSLGVQDRALPCTRALKVHGTGFLASTLLEVMMLDELMRNLQTFWQMHIVDDRQLMLAKQSTDLQARPCA